MPDHSPSTDERASLAQPSQSSSPLECTSHLGFSLVITEGPEVVPFPADTFELSNAKRYGLRSLVGLLADRHKECQLPHPFCGPPPGPGEGFLTLVKRLRRLSRREPAETPSWPCTSVRPILQEKYATADSEVDPLEYTAFLAPRENVPNSKVVINLLSDGTYRGELGSIANPVEGDHSTGRLDRTISTELLRPGPGAVSCDMGILREPGYRGAEGGAGVSLLHAAR